MTPVLRYRRGKAVTDHVSMFSGYCFARFDRLTDQWQGISKDCCDGVVRVLATRTGIPLPLPPGFVEGLIETSAQRLKLPEVKMHVFAKGQELVVVDGPFAQFHAVCDECDGLTTSAWVSIFGRSTRYTAPRASFRVA